MGAASFLVLFSVVLYVVMPTGPGVDMTVRVGRDPATTRADGSQSGYEAARVSHRGVKSESTEVVYGRITGTNGARVSKATLEIEGRSRGVSDQSTEVAVDATGGYRAVLHLPAGRYKATLRMQANGHEVVANRPLQLADSYAYELSASVGTGQVFSMLPVSGY